MLHRLALDDPDFLSCVESAMADDPLYHLLSPSELQRKKLVNIFSSRLLRCSQSPMKGYRIGERIDAAVIWSDLSKKRDYSRLDSLKCQLRMLTSGSMREISRIQKPFESMGKNIVQLQNQCDRYLSLLMVDSRKRGQGLASQLVYPQLQKYDQKNKVCGVDTFNPDNLPIYQNFGFKLVSSVTFGDGVTNFQMIREPTLSEW